MASDTKMAPVYLIVGEDDLKRESAEKRLLARFATMGDADFNTEVLEASKVDADTIVDSCNTLPFASAMRLVLVRDVEKLSKDDTAQLVDYLLGPCDTTVLCLVATKLARNTALYKAVAKSYPKSIVDCAPKGRRELPTVVRGMAAAHGVSMTPAAAELLIASVGESTIRLDTEVGKLSAALPKGGTIDDKLVGRMVAKTVDVKPWELTDALAARDARRLEQTLSRMSDESPLGLLVLCTNRIRDLMTVKALEERGRATDAASVLGKQDWQVRNYLGWARGFSGEELRRALCDAARAERDMKTGADQSLTFETWALGVCVRR